MKRLYFKLKNRGVFVTEIAKYKEIIANTYNSVYSDIVDMKNPYVLKHSMLLSLNKDLLRIYDEYARLLKRVCRSRVVDENDLNIMMKNFTNEVKKYINNLSNAIKGTCNFLLNTKTVKDFLTENGDGSYYLKDNVLFKLGFVPAIQYHDYEDLVSSMTVNFVYKCYVEVHIDDDMLVCRLPDGEFEYYYTGIVRLYEASSREDGVEALKFLHGKLGDVVNERKLILKTINNNEYEK